MTTFNSDYSNTELLDQELTTAELSQVSGGMRWIEDDDPAWTDPANQVQPIAISGGYEPPLIHPNYPRYHPPVNF